MGEIINGIPIVSVGWVVLRDVANMVFIFILVYASIATVLGIGNPRKMIVNAIITAILLNFSLFFTKAVIDVSNMVTLQFYNAINVTSGVQGDQRRIEHQEWTADGPSAAMMETVRLQTLYNYDRMDKSLTPANLLAGLGITQAADILTNPQRLLIVALGGGIMMLIMAFVFAAGAILLSIRIIVLMFLMMFSSLAFVSRILPGTSALWNKWVHSLISNVIFAPVYMIMVYIIVKMVGQGFSGVPSLQLGSSSLLFALAGQTSNMGLLFNYILMIGLLIGALSAAKMTGAIGATTVVGWGDSMQKSVRGWVGRNTAGRLATGWEKQLQNTSFGKSRLGSALISGTVGKAASATYGGKKSYKEAEDAREAALKKPIQNIGTDGEKLYEMMSRPRGAKGLVGGFSDIDAEKMYKESMLERQKVAYETTVRQKAATGDARAITLLSELDKYKSKLNLDQREKIETAYIREHRDKPTDIATHLASEITDDKLRNSLYNELQPRDRVAVEQAMLNTPGFVAPGGIPVQTFIANLRASLSQEDRDKTEKSARETAKNVAQDEVRSDLRTLADIIQTEMTRVGATNLERYFASPGRTINYSDSRGNHVLTSYDMARDHIENSANRANNQTLESLTSSQLINLSPGIDGGQFSNLQSSNNISRADKQAMKNSRYFALGRALGTGAFGTPPGIPNPAAVAGIIGNMDPDDIAGLPQNVLTNAAVISAMTPSVLEKIKGISVNSRSSIGNYIRNIAGPTHPSYEYVTTGASQHLWR
jgi:hypothetical protein